MSILLYTKSVCVIRNSDGVEEWGYRVNKNIFFYSIHCRMRIYEYI